MNVKFGIWSKSYKELIVSLFLTLLISLISYSVSANNSIIDIKFKENRVWMNIKNANIVDVLRELSKRSGIKIIVGSGINGKISIEIHGIPLDKAIGRICKSNALIYKYDQKDRIYKILQASIFKKRERSEDAIYINNSCAEKERPSYIKGELLIRYKKGIDLEKLRKFHESIGSRVIDEIPKRRIQRIRLKEGLTEEEAIRLYYDSGLVDLAEKHALRYPQGSFPDDPYITLQWAMEKISAFDAWRVTQGKPEVIVAVIDTGVDYSNPDLSENIWINAAELNGEQGKDDDGDGYVDDIYGYDFADNDPDPMDVDGHGTFVAGIIGAKGNNGMGIAGMCWNVKIMPLKIQDSSGNMLVDYEIKAIEYAKEKGANIINFSIGAKIPSQLEYEYIKNSGILAVCAAGNGYFYSPYFISEGIDLDKDKKIYPACYDLDNIISVAASTEEDSLASFSNYGKVSVDLMAPGKEITSLKLGSQYIEAIVRVVSGASGNNYTEYQANPLEFAGLTGQDGIHGILYDCGSGNNLSEFPKDINGNIALIARDQKVTFKEKVKNAISAGAAGAIIYNNEPGNFLGTLSEPGDWIPSVSISKEDGIYLKSICPVEVTLINREREDGIPYEKRDGTSMSTPFVTGTAALLLSRYPDLNYQKIKDIILKTTKKIPEIKDMILTSGRLNAFQAVCYPDRIPGDINCDKELGLEDLILSLQILTESETLPSECRFSATPCLDIDGDSRLGLAEIIYIFQKLSEVKE